jgi:DNA-nicking Smr family endonuclease
VSVSSHKAGSLAELARIRTALHERRSLVDATASAERGRPLEDDAARDREGSLFASTVGQVNSLRKGAAPPPARPRPAPVARQRVRDEAKALAESISDEFTAESLLDTDDALSYRRSGIGIDVVRKLRRGVWVMQAETDLHGLRRDEARERIDAFLREAVRDGLRCVRVVHGKGLGSPGKEPVLKAKVKSWLAQRSEVLAFTHARPADGGHGALLVLLRPGAKRPAPWPPRHR